MAGGKTKTPVTKPKKTLVDQMEDKTVDSEAVNLSDNENDQQGGNLTSQNQVSEKEATQGSEKMGEEVPVTPSTPTTSSSKSKDKTRKAQEARELKKKYRLLKNGYFFIGVYFNKKSEKIFLHRMNLLKLTSEYNSFFRSFIFFQQFCHERLDQENARLKAQCKDMEDARELEKNGDPENQSIQVDFNDVPAPRGKRPQPKTPKGILKKSKKSKKNLPEKMFDTTSGESSSSSDDGNTSGGYTTDDQDTVEKRSIITKSLYKGFLNDRAFLSKLSRGPRSSVGGLNVFLESLEDLPDGLNLEGGRYYKKWGRDLTENSRSLEEMVVYSSKNKDVAKKVKQMADTFEDLRKKSLPSRRKGALKRILGWLKKSSTQKVISTELATDIIDAMESERDDNRRMFKASSIGLENWQSQVEMRSSRPRGGFGGNRSRGGNYGNNGGGRGGFNGGGRGGQGGRGRGGRGGGRGRGGRGGSFGGYGGQSNQGNQSLYGQTPSTL